MFEKVNPAHPDKVADRIAGAVVDIAYETQIDPKVAVEVLIGHGICHIIAETSATLNENKVIAAVHRIAGNLDVDLVVVPQDTHLARNQKDTIRCGDNGIFKGVPMTEEQRVMSNVARAIYAQYPFDGKYILDGDRLIICQSNVNSDILRFQYPGAIVNPLAPTQVAKEPGAVLSGYTVRRLTPTECARLQGFPDWWCSGLGTTEPTAASLPPVPRCGQAGEHLRRNLHRQRPRNCMGDEPLKYKEEPIMAKTGLEIINAPETTAEQLAAIMANSHPTFEEGGAVACDKVTCEQCWLAWLTTGKPPIPTKK